MKVRTLERVMKENWKSNRSFAGLLHRSRMRPPQCTIESGPTDPSLISLASLEIRASEAASRHVG